MKRIAKALLHTVLTAVAALVLISLVTLRHSDPALYPSANGEETFVVSVADHGVHAGLIIRLADIDAIARQTDDPVLQAVLTRFDAYQWLEIGWGDEDFYRFAPALSDVTVRMAFNALAGLNKTAVLHVAGLHDNAAASFPRSDVVDLRLTRRGLARLVGGLSKSFGRQSMESFAAESIDRPIELGPGIYGPSLFYRATGHYSVLNTCNRWIADLLASAGVAASPVPATLSGGLIAELRWRNF